MYPDITSETASYRKQEEDEVEEPFTLDNSISSRDSCGCSGDCDTCEHCNERPIDTEVCDMTPNLTGFEDVL